MKKLFAAASCSILLAACAGMMQKEPSASAALQPTKANQASGTVTFTPKSNKMLVVASVTGLTPGLHGFHVHEKGDCSAPDATSAGGHFNPGGTSHGAPHDANRHAGDLGNLNADSSGVAKLEIEVEGLSLEGANGVVGRSVVVHANPDDLKSQPAGNSGPRVACGVIRLTQTGAPSGGPSYRY